MSESPVRCPVWIRRDELTMAMRRQIADWLAEDCLPIVNKNCKEVVFHETFYSKYGKRALDILLSLIAIVLTLPVNILIGIVTYFDVGRPIFFTQERVGKDGRVFRIVKFRNMRNAVDEQGEPLPPAQRVTKWGKFVRRTSLDELLNFYSVLKGDMALIGPRPLPPVYMMRYSKRHLARYRVRPGIECPPRNPHSRRTWNDQLENDVWYVENLSLKTDILQVFNLIRFALDRKNSAMRAEASRGDFMGYNEKGEVLGTWDVPESYIERAVYGPQGSKERPRPAKRERGVGFAAIP